MTVNKHKLNFRYICHSSTALLLLCICFNANAATLTLPATSTTGTFTISWSTTKTVGLVDELQSGSWVTIAGAQSGSTTVTKTSSGTYTYRLEDCTGSQSGLSCVYGTPKSIVVTLSSSSSSSSVAAGTLCNLGTGNTTSYCYDELGRVTAVRYPNGVVNTYKYDAADNRTQKQSTQN